MRTVIKTTYVIFSIVLSFSGHAQINFETFIPGVYGNYGSDVVPISDSGYVVCGSDGTYFGQWPFWQMTLIKTDKFGSVVWRNLYGLSFENRGSSVQQTSDGGLIACGHSWVSAMMQALLVRTAPDGELVFIRSYTVNGSTTYSFTVKQCFDQGFVLCGRIEPYSGTPPVESCLIRTNLSGDTLWSRAYQNGYPESGASVICLPDSGFSMLSNDFSTITILRELDSIGETEWMKTYTSLIGTAFSKTDDEGYIITGIVTSGNFNQIGLLKTDRNGDSVWFRVYPYDVNPGSVEVRKDGGFLIGGTINNSPSAGLNQLFLLRTDQDGDPVWTRKWGGAGGDFGSAVRNTFDDGYIFTGAAKKPGTDSTMVILIKGNEDSTMTAVSDIQASTDPLMIYPNPSEGLINIKLEGVSEEVCLEIRDVIGNCIYKHQFARISDLLNIQIPFTDTGIYVVIIKTPDYIKTGKIFFQRQAK
jgi:hypothetical protein